MKRLVIVQPYVPRYRVAFFQGLVETLADRGVEVRILAGVPSGSQDMRGDAASAEWILAYKARELSFGGRSLKLGGAARHWADADAVIVGLIGTSLDTYRAILGSKGSNMRVGVWGHIKSYVNRENVIDAALERWQLRHAHHVFAYTPGGASQAVERGVSSEKVTTVMNTIPTHELAVARESLQASEVTAFKAEFGLADQPTFGYVGGLDSSKRIDFLAAALDVMWRRDPSARVLVAGRGSQERLLAEAAARGQVRMLGYADALMKARIAASSHALLNPGRVGLVAVDALVLGRPILTTRWPFHAPEIEYLVEGESLHTTPNDPESFALEALRLVAEQVGVGPRKFNFPLMSDMIHRFGAGVMTLMGP